MNSKNFLAPSILDANFMDLKNQLDPVFKDNNNIIHLDIMDAHYVPNLTFGPFLCSQIKNYLPNLIDVHLMVEPVDPLVERFAHAGANMISFHPEASLHVHRSIELIKSFGCKAGLALNPSTPISAIEDVLSGLDFVLIMSVNPGFGSQKFIENSLRKIERLNSMIINNSYECQIEVDGGINNSNILSVKKAGANIFVIGSAIFKSENITKSAQFFHNIINSD